MNLSIFILSLNFIYGFTFFLKDSPNLSDEFQFHLATKTPYRVVANTTATEINIEGCEPQKIWMLTRHGTRNPSEDLIEKMKERLPEIRDIILKNNPEPTEHLSSSDLDALRKWESKLEAADEQNLVPEGEKEMFELAERMQIRFPSLFPATYSNTTYFFKYTASQRTEASAKYFTGGLFGMQAVDDVWYPEISKNDPILEFYKLCTKYNEDIKNNPETYRENEKFENSCHMVNAIESVNKILNFKDEEDILSMEDVNTIYMACSYETAWNETEKSPWCSAITLEAVKAMEFDEDLKYYYRDGYGFELTYKQACQAFNDMIRFFESDSQNPKATIYFTHSGTLSKMLAHLGLYQDGKHITHEDFENDYKWRTSKIDAFGTNLAFVLHKCKDRQKVMVFHQENLVQLPDCGDICDFQDIKQQYSESINNCAFDEMCNNTKPYFM